MSESEFHYVRTYGADGGVEAVDGRAIGVDLESILKDGLPPFKIALEVIAALCEVLDIADQDGETHGDVHPSNIFIDDTGAVSLEGYGLDRDETFAPEHKPDGPLTDLYGLGYVAYRLLAPRDLTGLPDDPDAHDDAVIDAVVALPWGDMPEEWVGDIQWFLAKLMSFDPEERPSAVDAWRTFIAFAEEAQGASIPDWAPDAIEGGGERRDAAMAVRPTADEDEDLGGPVVTSGPLSKGAISFGGGAKSGQATAFWSKDQMKAALEAEPAEEEEEQQSFKPAVGGGAATSFWTRDQMEAMARGDAEAPRPKRKEGGKKANRSAPVPDATSPAVSAAPPPAPLPTPPPPVAPPPVAPPPVASSQPVAGGSIAAGPSVASPGAVPPGYGAADDDDDEGGGGGGAKFALIGCAVVGLLLLCLGGGGGIAAFFLMGNSGTATVDVDPGDKVEVETNRDEDAADEDKTDATEAQDTAVEDLNAGADPTEEKADKPLDPPKSTQSSSRSSTSSGTRSSTSGNRSTTSSSRSSSRNRSATSSSTAAAGPTRVVFTVPGTGSIRCGDGTNKEADGRASITFKSVPSDGITCTFYAEGSKPVCAGFVMPGNRKCNCAGSDLTCS